MAERIEDWPASRARRNPSEYARLCGRAWRARVRSVLMSAGCLSGCGLPVRDCAAVSESPAAFGFRSGRCPRCSRRSRIAVYCWPASKGPLWSAWCPVCGAGLVNTCVANIRADRRALRFQLPEFKRPDGAAPGARIVSGRLVL